MSEHSPLFAALLVGLLASTSPVASTAQVPTPTMDLGPAWQNAVQAIERELTATVVNVEDNLRVFQRTEAWERLDCGLARLSELRTLRDSVADAGTALHTALRVGHNAEARHHWQTVVAARLHGEVLALEAEACGAGTPIREQRVVVRVTGPAWDVDGEYGAPAVPGAALATVTHHR